MNLRSLLSAVLLVVPLSLEGSTCDVSGPADSVVGDSQTVSKGDCSPPRDLDWQPWLAFDLSPEQLEADYQRTIGKGAAEEADHLTTEVVGRTVDGLEVMIPVVFLAEPQNEEGPAEEGEAQVGEDEEPATEDEKIDERELRIRELELEIAALKKRLLQLEPAIEPVEPFVDPDWPPAEVSPKRRIRVRPRRVLPPSFERPIRLPLVAVSRDPVRFRPFTRAAMDTPSSGRTSRAREQSRKEQLRFFRNASKALGARVGSKEYRGVRLEVERAMLRGELNPRYAVQYLADVIDVFRSYESLKRFGLTDRLTPPVSANAFRQDPDSMFRWASEVTEQRRKLDLEGSQPR